MYIFYVSAKQQISVSCNTGNKRVSLAIPPPQNGYVTIISNAVLCGMCKRKSISHTRTHTNTSERITFIFINLNTQAKASLVWVWLMLLILDYFEHQDISFSDT